MVPTLSLLLIDDDPGIVQVLGRMLCGLGHLRFALSGQDALRLARESAPDVVLVDADMPGMSGFEFCALMKADPQLAEVPVIFVSSHGEVETEVAAFAAGAADFIRKPPAAEVVMVRVRTQLRLKALADALRRAALVDGLTGVANRRRFDEQLQSECERALRNGEPLSLLMIDVDHFKRYNDRYGHPAGDLCLQEVATAVQGLVRRPADQVARYGGEEFAMLLPQTDLTGASHLAERVVAAVEALCIPHEGSPPRRVVTVSVGVASASRMPAANHTALSAEALIRAADQALYAAKAAGRCQSQTYRPPIATGEFGGAID
ncbi:MAG: diguanylate cyclase response regulator [Burkholderiales bacterium PBB1]|nr:MAG: diguanylate cyclase response regulator [Burkholderiales bacterium PBB1]